MLQEYCEEIVADFLAEEPDVADAGKIEVVFRCDEFLLVRLPLISPKEYEEVMDILELDLMMGILYEDLAVPSDPSSLAFCTISSMRDGHMFKMNGVRCGDGMVSELLLSVFCSVEDYASSLYDEVVSHFPLGDARSDSLIRTIHDALS